ncbi:MAG TPA: hypothetical protein VMD28_00740 [Acidimicrobiales bacterium]|nr:hypothetical protein [Acidimicrobiales bacterium]
MHPDLLAALVRQRNQELLDPTERWRPTEPWRPDLAARAVLRRVRARVGAAFVDVGVHLMTFT